ncbi:hypothetical protein GCM10017567_60510 [Amycolatopsis bullii]|uniref:Uncharacterized protein n=1 Tax=Amycolatopsis bullii TaxID=941987 RepID=A0ABQ3KKD5_9PSEU|nr:hypothetical protein GCM10017567_60510 [Amycolatopsis bullii]
MRSEGRGDGMAGSGSGAGKYSVSANTPGKAIRTAERGSAVSAVATGLAGFGALGAGIPVLFHVRTSLGESGSNG